MSSGRPPARNRVTPFGEVVAVAGRGAWMGNRGRLHEGEGSRDVVRSHQTRAWITCALSFRGRRVPQWHPRHYTPLFFLDEAVALAAGHRPCAECRRGDYLAYRAAWAETHGGSSPYAKDLDDQLHRERRPARAGTDPAGTDPAGTDPAGTDPAGTERARTDRARTDRATHVLPWSGLPDGTFVVLEHRAAVVAGDQLAVWDARGNAYGERLSRPRAGSAAVLTPLSSVGVLRAGYPVHLDPGAR